MAIRNIYLTYKRDTSRLLYWVINTSNGIVRSAVDVEDHAPVTINTTGHSTVLEIVQMSKLIAKHLQPIPTDILSLFRSVIKARSATYDAFQQIVDERPDPETERSNATHKYFIEALTEAFNALGGNSLSLQADSESTEEDNGGELTFENRFLALSTGGGSDDDGESDASQEIESSSRVNAQKKNAKGKRKTGKRAKSSKKKASSKPTPEPSLADVSIESYRIIEASDDNVSEYLLAVYMVTREWITLRSYIQRCWREVAYDGLNGAIAGSLTNIAVAIVQQTSNAVFVDFPGHDSYETIMRTLTRGDPKKAQEKFGIDIKEQIWINTYQQLD